MRKIYLAPIVFLTVTGCHHEQTIQADQAAPIAAKVIVVSTSVAKSIQSLEGVVAARQQANLSSQVLAPVASVAVKEGDRVHKGQVVIRLASAPLRAMVDQSRAQLLAASQQQDAAQSQKALAAATYERYAALDKQHAVTPYEFDQVKTKLAVASAASHASGAQVTAAEAAVRGAEAANDYSAIRAPFNGIVTRKFIDAGGMASPGIPLLQIEDASGYEVDLQVNEADLNAFHSGGTVQVIVNGEATAVLGRVAEVVPSGDTAAHSFTVKIGLPQGQKVYSGMSAHVFLPGPEQSMTEVPSGAVRRRGQLDSVLALDSNSIAQIRYVSLGQPEGSRIQVISGLGPGDRILAQPDDSMIGHRIESQR